MSGNKLSFAILLYKIVSVGQTALSGLLAAVIVYGVALPPHLAWGLNLALAGIVLLIGLYFYLRLRAFRRVNPVVEGLRQFIRLGFVIANPDYFRFGRHSGGGILLGVR